MADRRGKSRFCTGQRLKNYSIDAIYTSPLGRAKDTAKPTAEALGVTPVVCDWLREFSIGVRRPDLGGALSPVPWDWLPLWQ